MMSLQELGIEHKRVAGMLAATMRVNLKKRAELRDLLRELDEHIPAGYIAGPAFSIFQFMTSYEEGYEVELGFPVSRAVEAGRIKSRMTPPLEVLSIVHRGPIEELSASFRKVIGYAREHALISDEFRREVYPDWNNPDHEVEMQYVLHDWNGLLARNLERVLGAEACQEVMLGRQTITLESTLEERFQWVKGAMERLDRLAGDFQRYDVVSSCAHVFPRGLLDDLRAVYEKARAGGTDALSAVDAVIAYILAERSWGDRSLYREGRVIYGTKPPADIQGYEQARTAAEKRSAYCYCPIVRTNLDRGMPGTYCFCGSGWYRQQWEHVTGKPVRVEVVQSVLQGDEVCQFAVHLSEDL